jgi:tetratricopeptide (TPR) repeat protein
MSAVKSKRPRRFSTLRIFANEDASTGLEGHLVRMIGLTALLALAIAAAPAYAAEYTDCNKETSKEGGGNGIQVCTQLINTGRWKGLELARLYSNRSLAYTKAEKLDSALADADRAIRISPDYVFAYDNRGEIKRMRGDFDSAIVDFNTAIRLDPEFLAAYLDRGTTFNQMGNRKSARADFQTVLDMKGKDRAVDKWAKTRAQELLDELGSGD